MTTNKYSEWSAVPDGLKTKNQLRKMKLKPAPDQQPAAQKTGGYGPYDLYAVADAVPVRTMSEAQREALEAARAAQYCKECGGHTSQVGRLAKRNGYCLSCWLPLRAYKRVMEETLTAAYGEYVAIDTETTSLDAPEIVQIAIVDQRGAILLNERLRPISAIEPQATAVHGHTAESLADCPTWRDIWPRVNEILDLRVMLAYNMEFDWRAIINTCRLHRTKRPTPWLRACIMHAFAAEFGDWSERHRDFRWQSLATAVQYFGLKNDETHDAAGDAVAALRVLHRLLANKP